MHSQNQFESLEPRRMFSGASVSHGVLRVYGDPFNRNIITVANSADGTNVDVSISWTTLAGVKKNFSASVPKTLDIKKINIFGSFRADTVNVGQTNGALGIRTRIDVGRGNDIVTTGSENDVVYAGRGNDVVKTGGGNDLVHGGLGDDNISGENGNDTLWGGNGNDTVNGGDGDDKLGGILATNTLSGGAGKDEFLVKSLDANPTNDFNATEDVLTVVPHDDATDPDAPAGVTS
jgi:Ca2+-binding RTX toxin-like protein